MVKQTANLSVIAHVFSLVRSTRNRQQGSFLKAFRFRLQDSFCLVIQRPRPAGAFKSYENVSAVFTTRTRDV